MGKYAADTVVSADKSIDEIRRTLRAYGGKDFTYGERESAVVIGFRIKDRLVRLEVKLPPTSAFAWSSGVEYRGRRRTVQQQREARDKEVRRRHRVLLLWLKAKLEAADDDSGMTTVEAEFLPWTVLPSGETASERWEPLVRRAIAAGEMPSDLLALPAGDR